MGKRMRYAVNIAANLIEDASGRVVEWLRQNGARPMRQRPVVFPSPLWLQMMDMNDKMIRAMVPHIADEIVRGIPMVYDTSRSESPIKIRIPADG